MPVWASVESEVIGADRNPQQREAIKAEISRTLTEIEATFLFAIRVQLQDSPLRHVSNDLKFIAAQLN